MRETEYNLDSRWIGNGRVIPSEGYADQPYVVQTDDGAWLCVITTAAGHEGQPGQHVVSFRSFDEGRTWIDRADVEPTDGPEASYAVLLKAPAGRIYCFYNHNTDNVREAQMEDGNIAHRVDSLGHYVFKFSDDHGRTWSPRRYEVPVREFACDRGNLYGGRLRFFWNVGRPLALGSVAYLTLHKVAALGVGFYAQSEGAILRSDNLLSEREPERIRFETLPEGDVGLRAPAGGGRIAEEQCLTALSDGSLYCVYRTVDGHPACAFSRDGGRTWTPPAYKAYSPGGRLFRHPRAANFVWRCRNGQFLYWFHNHGGHWYEDRNPAWLCAGREVATPAGRLLEWGQPEILLYDDDPAVRMSYPDLIELPDGRFFITETQKAIARVHEIEAALVAGLFGQWEDCRVARDGLLLEWEATNRGRDARDTCGTPASALEAGVPPSSKTLRSGGLLVGENAAGTHLGGAMAACGHASQQRGRDARDTSGTSLPSLPELCRDEKNPRPGFTLELALTLPDLAAGQTLLDSRDASGAGILLATTPRGTIELTLSDGHQSSRWDCDADLIQPGRRCHLAAIVDGGPRIIMFLVDGVLCDGGEARQFGWGRLSPTLAHVNSAAEMAIGRPVQSLRLYGRALRTSEAVGNYRASCKE